MKWPLLLLVPWASLVPSSAQAQVDFSATTLATGQRVRVTDPSGLRVEGAVTSVTPSSLSVAGRTFRPEVGLRVERVGDSIWNGILLGSIAGGILGGSTSRTGCFSGRSVGCVVKPGIVFGIIGGLVDHRIVGRRTVFLGTPASSSTP